MIMKKATVESTNNKKMTYRPKSTRRHATSAERGRVAIVGDEDNLHYSVSTCNESDFGCSVLETSPEGGVSVFT